MSYEDAPSTKLLASHCAVCARPLRDAVSVELGIGPICRERHGYDEASVSEEARSAANVLIHRIAASRREPATLATGVSALRELGFAKLAERILRHGHAVPISGPVQLRRSSRGTGWYVRAPYKVEATWGAIPGRHWDPETKEWFVPWAGRDALLALLSRCYAGHALVSLSGETSEIGSTGLALQIPTPLAVTPESASGSLTPSLGLGLGLAHA